MPDHIPSPHDSGNGSPSPNTFLQSRSPSQHPNGPPISPPKTRSASADDNSAALVEDWRAYTQKLRSQSEGERAHMAADRARMEEVMAEERALWDREREILKARIAELEAELVKRGSGTSNPQPISPPPKQRPNPVPISFTSPGSNAVSVTSSIDGSSRGVPQESGRNADGSPFYAPAPRNPSRTFDVSELGEVRVDSMTAPRETAIRVTSKELTSSDFGPQSPPSHHSLPPIPETSTESIDISHIQPELEGVLIKATAVSPTFAAKVLSPQRSPPKLSPDVNAPGRDVTNVSRSTSGGSTVKEKERKTLEIVCQPENRRLTMHAGHTPNHSITKFGFLGAGESGNATPTQEHHGPDHEFGHDQRETSFMPGYEHTAQPVKQENQNHNQDHGEEDQGDKELTGPLGFINDATKDDAFLAQLVEKLEEARKSADVSSSTGSSSSHQSKNRSLSPRTRPLAGDRDDEEEDKDDGPPLRLKPSFNFGRPMGSM
jgi:hypothetical protein